MAEWLKPKTDWNGYENASGEYVGDRFNASDYNRIKGNIEYLRDLAVNMLDDFDITKIGFKEVGEYIYADEINTIESNLESLNSNTVRISIGETKTYYPNTAFIDYVELNRIESATENLYKKIMQRYEHRRMLGQNFEKGGLSW